MYGLPNEPELGGIVRPQAVPITTVRIDEIWHTVRPREPVRFSLPLARGVLSNVDDLRLKLEDEELPIQTRILSKWPDGSVRWALLDFQADLDLRLGADLDVYSGAGPRPTPAKAIRIDETDATIQVDTGAISVDIFKTGAPRLDNVRARDGLALASTGGLSLDIHDEFLGLLTLETTEASVATAGPLVAEVTASATGHEDSSRVLDAQVLYRFFADKPWVHAYVTIMSRERDLGISQVRVALRPDSMGATPELRVHTGMKKARASDTELLYDFAVDARSDPIWYEDSPEPCWALWRCSEGGVMASVRNADHHFPTRIALSEDGIDLDLHPAGNDSFHMYPWMGKTNEILVGFVTSDKSGYDMTLDSALFQRPVRPVCSPEYYAECQALGRIFPTSRKYAGFEGLISTSLRARPVGVGAMHYGDEPNLGYTYSGRGHDDMVWTNGEYDTPRMLLMQYARTSNRSWFEAAEAAALHWMDIDFLRDSPNPRWAGGLCCHEGDHRVAAYAGPSHEWAEGLVDYYHLTGYERALRTAESIGDNVCRYIEDGQFDAIGTYALRELGWGLTAIAGCLRATNGDRYRRTGLRAVRILRRWADELGGFRDVSRYTDDGGDDSLRPLTVQRDAFISLTLNGLDRFYRASGEQEAKSLFLEQVEAQLKWFSSPAGWWEQRETKIPNVEAFGSAYEYTKNTDYVDAALQILEYALTNCTLRYYELGRSVLDDSHSHPSTYRIQEVHAINSQILGLALIPMFSFLQTAEDAGVLQDWMAGYRRG